MMSAALALCGAASHAQPATAAKTELAAQKAEIKVRSLPAETMAYWLDPKGQPMPSGLQISRNNGGGWTRDVELMTRQPGNGNGPRDLKMPADVQIVAALAPSNSLLVKGTPSGIEALRQLVERIDVPLGQVEIEAQIWEIAPAEFAQLPLVFRNVSRSTSAFDDTTFGELALAVPTGEIAPIAQQLQSWQAAQRAKVINAPRVTAIDGMAATLSSTETRSFNVDQMEESKPQQEPAEDETDEAIQMPLPYEEKIDDGWTWGKSRVQNQTGLKAIAVLHGDLIALGFQVMLDNQITRASTILRDGQTLPIRLSGASESGWPRVVLLQIRTLKREGDDVIVPGT